MKFTKILPYKLRRALPILGLAGATIALNGCSKDDEQITQHDTVYTWGCDKYSEIWPTDKINASADSVQVRFVILKNDGAAWGSDVNGKAGAPDSFILNSVILPVEAKIKQQNMKKVMWQGELVNVNKATTPEEIDAFNELEARGLKHTWTKDFWYNPVVSKLEAQNQR